MLRNREIIIYATIEILLSLAVALVAALFSFHAFLFVLIISLTLVISHLLFTWWRYRELRKLSEYLRKIAAGDYFLDIRDNFEGELSILKNEIYKVTRILSESGTRLKDEKMALTDAISDISHQLKTPLTSMMMMTEFLKDEKLPQEKRKEFTGKIQRQLERIEWLVSALLKLSKIDAGTAVFKEERVLVKDVIKNAIDPMLIPMDIKGISLKINGNDEDAFIGDLNWTTEAFVNIFKNCIEHTDNGGEITISYEENPLFTQISIKDSGKGIPKEDVPYIFKRFYKGKNAGEDSVGIGLAMAYSIVTSQNGAIVVNSQEGVGTEFIIKFYKNIV